MGSSTKRGDELMAIREKAEPGTVTWAELHTPDLAAAKKFYGALLGWSFEGGDDPTKHFYTMALLDNHKVAGIHQMAPNAPYPPNWGIYIAVEDADATTAQAAEAGGQTIIRPVDVADEGRMAHLTDPSGAHFGIWQAKKHQGAVIFDEQNAMVWNEVYTRDANAAQAFYTRVFNLSIKKLDAPGIDYYTLQKGEKTVFGLMQMGPQFPKEVPSHWNTYFAVPDADIAAKQVESLGGKVFAPPFDTPYGRMLAACDPTSAAFCLIKPISTSTTW